MASPKTKLPVTLAERHQYIMEKLKKQGKVLVVDLCKELKVSAVTLRKDLKLLEDKNLLYRTHGGGTLTNPYATEKPINQKEKLRSSEKMSIGEYAASLIEPHDCIIIASGTTVLSVARSIKAQGHLTVITPALNVAAEVSPLPQVEVLLLGGSLRKSSTSVTGMYAEKMLNDFSCNKLFLGVDGIDIEFGLSTTNIQEAQLNKKMIGVAQKTIVVADSSKFGKKSFGRICGLEQVHHIITDDRIAAASVDALKNLGITVTVV